MHRNKKNGGLAYTRWTTLDIPIRSNNQLTISYVVLNAARGSNQLVLSTLEHLDGTMKHQHSTFRHVDAMPSVSAARVEIASLSKVALLTLARSAIDTLQSLLTNQDGPVAYNTIRITRPQELNIHHHINMDCSCEGMKNRAYYLVHSVGVVHSVACGC